MKDQNSVDGKEGNKVKIKPKNGKLKYIVRYRRSGKRLTRKFDTLKQAEDFIESYEKSVKGKRVEVTTKGKRIQLGRAMTDTIDAMTRIESSTRLNYRRNVDLLDKRELATYMDDIDNDFLEAIRKRLSINARTGKASKGHVFKEFINTLRATNKYHLKHGFLGITKVDLDDVHTPTTSGRRDGSYSLDQYKQVVNYFLSLKDSGKLHGNLPKMQAAVMAINMQLGLRVGELVVLTRDDFYIDNEGVTYVVVTKTAQQQDGGGVAISPKTKDARASVVKPRANEGISLDAPTVEMVNWLFSLNRGKGEFLIFGDRLASVKWFGDAIKATCKRLGLPYYPPHQAGRKTCASIANKALSDAGMSPVEIANILRDQLGHASTSTTLNSYIVTAKSQAKKRRGIFDMDTKTKKS